MTAQFKNTVEHWAAEITAEEKRLAFLVAQYQKLHTVKDWDYSRALSEMAKAEESIERLYRKLDEAHRMEAGIA
jgi:hypothetical protein